MWLCRLSHLIENEANPGGFMALRKFADAAICTLAGLDALDELYVFRTDMTIAGVKELKRLRPGCRIYYRSDQEPE